MSVKEEGTVVALNWTAGQHVERLIQHLGHDFKPEFISLS